jgi:excisionase family DNA binding protein
MLLDLQQAAKQYGVARSSLFRWGNEGKLTYIKTGRKRMFESTEIERLLEKKGGTIRPGPDKLQVDPAKLLSLARINCTYEEMAAVLDMSIRTFETRLAEDPELRALIKRGRSEGKASLRRVEWKSALAGDRTMMIWLGKNELGQRDSPIELTGPNKGPLVILQADRNGTGDGTKHRNETNDGGK